MREYKDGVQIRHTSNRQHEYTKIPKESTNKKPLRINSFSKVFDTSWWPNYCISMYKLVRYAIYETFIM